MPTKLELSIRQGIQENWASFQRYRTETLSHNLRGRNVNESDVRAVFERLLTDVLDYGPSQIDREADFADFMILYRGSKLVVCETKNWGLFQNDKILDEALNQGATYAVRHKVRYIIAFDAESLVLAEMINDEINVKVSSTVNSDTAPDEIFLFTHYGLSQVDSTSLRTIPVTIQLPISNEYKRHHKMDLHYTCFAYVGDLRDKSTWKMPYRNPDRTVDTGRIDKAVSYLLSASGYRGVQATEASVPEAAQPEVARRLAVAYQELGKWSYQTPSKAAKRLWDYLASRGETDLR